MSKFKIGDRVEIIDSCNATVDIGTLGTIDTIWDNGRVYNVRVDRVKDSFSPKMRLWSFGDDELIYVNMKEEGNKMVNFLKTNNSITLHYDGKTKVVAKDDARFEQVLQAIRSNKLDTIPGIVELERPLVQHGLEVEDGVVKMYGEAMPVELNNRILEYKKDNLPFTSLKLFWENLSQNPSFNSRKQLFKFLENKGHSITEDGYFIGYRGVTEDFKDRHSKTFNNAPGSVCEMPREAVNDNPNDTCSNGLHVGGYEYAKDFGKNGKLVMVKVNPKDVVAVPNDYDGQKMRVCRFEVLKEATDILSDVVVDPKGDKYQWSEEDMEEYEANDFEQDKSEESFDDGLPASAIKAAHETFRKSKYKNNHSKRDKFGRFKPNKKSAKKAGKRK